MSHFSVLVITDEKPSQDDLAAILQPWHEFECTGINDKHVVDVDVTAESIEWGNKRIADGEPEHRRLELALGYYGLEDAVVLNESEADTSGEHKHGYAVVQDGALVKAVHRTNPNKKWDWWQIGGRWSGLLRLKEHAIPELGRPGLAGSRADDHPLSSDVALIRDVDIATMRSEAEAKAGALWDKANAAVKDCPPVEAFDVVVERHNNAYESARQEYWSQPALVALKAAFPDSFFLSSEIDAISVDRDTFTNSAAARVLCTFAVVKDGQWYERGEMGWFGYAANENDKDAWSAEFAKLLDGLPETACLTVVDCHI